MDLSGVGLPALEALAAALEAGRLAGALTVPGTRAAAAMDLAGARAVVAFASGTGLSGSNLGRVLRAIAVERRRTQMLTDQLEFTWTGPDLLGSESRDTAVVVRDLFRRATRRVLVASYALDGGDKAKVLFGDLATKLDEDPELRVSFFVNVGRPFVDGAMDLTHEAELLRRFARRFRSDIWPGRRLPQVYYDPRALDPNPGPRACLHAKCVVVDDRFALVTSANFTEAAVERNIEAGVLLDNPPFATRVRRQFEMLMEAGGLRLVPGLDE